MAFARLRAVLALPLLIVLLGGVPVDAAAWGKAGHRVVAALATSLLASETQRQVADLLDPGVTLADIATWADEVRPNRPTTGPWHNVYIPRGASGYNAQRDCSQGCVVSAIEQSLRLLQDPSKGRAVHQEALKWVVHFVADLHQPLHAIADDRNEVLVQLASRQMNLHRLWDVDLIE
jgi:nuclease S1